MASIVESFVLAKSYTKSMNLGSSQQESLFLFCSLGKLSIIIKQLSNQSLQRNIILDMSSEQESRHTNKIEDWNLEIKQPQSQIPIDKAKSQIELVRERIESKEKQAPYKFQKPDLVEDSTALWRPPKSYKSEVVVLGYPISRANLIEAVMEKGDRDRGRRFERGRERKGAS